LGSPLSRVRYLVRYDRACFELWPERAGVLPSGYEVVIDRLARLPRTVVNADDFGLSSGVNRGIARAHDEGIVTSTSAMVRQDAIDEAVALASDRPRLSVGLHVDLSEWVYQDGDWVPLYQVVASEDRAAVEAEVAAQLASFVALFGCPPTHLDSHQHRHLEEPIRSVVVETGRRLGVPVRGCTPGVAYRGDFYGQTGRGEPFPEAITVEALVRLISSLPEGITELGCHPAAEPEQGSTYCAERPSELEALCDSRVKASLTDAGVELRSFGDVSASSVDA
jgi:chitin disaccharide deacetylase